MRRALVGLAAIVAFSAPSTASAFEKQWHLGGGLGAGVASAASGSLGPVGGLYAGYGLTDEFDLRLEFSAGLHDLTDGAPGSEEIGPSLAYTGAFGATYKLDVIEWIPYVGLLVGYAGFNGDAVPPGVAAESEQAVKGALDLSTIFGIDYALSRNTGLGAMLRYHAFMTDGLTDYPYMSFMLRAEYRWGW